MMPVRRISSSSRRMQTMPPLCSLMAVARFALSYGLKNLLGAVWLQMAWLLAAGDGVKRCELLDCFRVIAFEPGEQPPLDAPRGTRGKYKTRKDIRFCKNRGCKQKYHYRRTAGWPGYV
jgi:hypothetical protein